MVHSVVTTLLDDLLRSFGVAFIVITFLMIGMLRDIKLGLLAMVPNLLPIALILGVMGLTGIPIDLNNLLIGSIALGIAVDDTIHMLHHFGTAFRRTGDRELAIHESMRHAGRAMFSTSVLLIVGFGVYQFSTIVAVKRFGILIVATIATALVVDLSLGPALLRTFYGAKKDVT